MERQSRKRCKTLLWTAVTESLASLPTIHPTIPVPSCNSNEPDLFGDVTAGWNVNYNFLLPDVFAPFTRKNDKSTSLTYDGALQGDDHQNNKDGNMELFSTSTIIQCACCDQHMDRTQIYTDIILGRTFTHQQTPRKKKRMRLPLVEIGILGCDRNVNLNKRVHIREPTRNEFRTVFRLQDVCDRCKHEMETVEFPTIEASYRLTKTLLMEICGAKPSGSSVDENEQIDAEAWVECFQDQGMNFSIPSNLRMTHRIYTKSDVHNLFHIDVLVELIVTFLNPLYNVDLAHLFAPAMDMTSPESLAMHANKHTDDNASTIALH